MFSILSAVTPLGMENGSITNDQITASSSYNGSEPWDGRLNNPNGEWSTDNGDSTQPWIQVKFSSAVNITAIQTQGSSDANEWVSKLQIQTGDSEESLSYINDRNKESAVYVSIPYSNSYRVTKMSIMVEDAILTEHDTNLS